MNLTDFKKILRQALPIMVLAAVVVGAGIGAYLYFDNPKGEQAFGKLKQPKVTSLVSSKIKTAAVAAFQGSFPRLANVYRGGGALSTKTLLSKLGVSGEPKEMEAGKVFYWSSLTKNLVLDSEKQTFTFSDLTPIEPRKISESQAVERAKSYIKSLGLVGADIVLEKSSVKYLIYNPFHVEEVKATSNFTAYALDFAAKLEGVPIVNNFGEEALFSVTVGVDGEIKKIQASLEKLIFSEKSTYPVKHAPTVKEKVTQGAAKIIDVSQKYTPGGALAVTFNKAKLVYYLTGEKTPYLQPVFLLTAENSLQGSLVTAVLEALKSEVYRP